MPSIYAAGPITGLVHAEATDWRKYIRERLNPDIQVFSPMRGKDYLSAIGKISGTGEEYRHFGPLSLPRGVTTRDRFDCTRSDLLFVNLLGADRVSIGTCFEVAWADLYRIPIILVMEGSGNPHEHMMLQEMVGFRTESLDEAISLTRMILLEG